MLKSLLPILLKVTENLIFFNYIDNVLAGIIMI